MYPVAISCLNFPNKVELSTIFCCSFSFTMTQKVHGQKIDIEAVHRTRNFRQENNSENFDFRFF